MDGFPLQAIAFDTTDDHAKHRHNDGQEQHRSETELPSTSLGTNLQSRLGCHGGTL
jgi:hypothetical protein